MDSKKQQYKVAELISADKGYDEICKSAFGEKAFDAMLEFASLAKEFVPNVTLSIVNHDITKEEIEDCREIAKKCGVCVVGQTGNFAPADKKLYALRDVTATVDNVPLIASSIMSKKLAAGANTIVLDVKCGSGAFMKTEQDAKALAECMVEIGENFDKNTAAVITNMDTPLGLNIGNA